ncbi:MAG: dihydropteroate synthase [Alistipes sp.]|nr:dihydropteroate synthase [Alistipes sp.]
MNLSGRELNFREPQVMAILNVTDDSFYAGSRNMEERAISERVVQAIEEGATIIDVGGYSTRSGAKDISLEEEWQRVERGLKCIRDISEDIAISVDTFRSGVVERAVALVGDIIVNDISAGEADTRMVDVVAHHKLPYIAMHMRGTPQTMQSMTQYEEGICESVCRYFTQRVEYLRQRGVNDIILDPGFGFAKSVEQNFELLGGLSSLSALGYPVLAGLSRKSMIYRALDITPEESLAGTVALNWEALRQGASILRVHDVREARQVIELYNRVKKQG